VSGVTVMAFARSGRSGRRWAKILATGAGNGRTGAMQTVRVSGSSSSLVVEPTAAELELLDVALALLVGILCEIPSHAIWLGAAAGLLSAAMATTPYLHRPKLVRKDGVWWQRRGNGELTRLHVIPRSLRLWASYSSE
jgi:hypothetical protein